MRVRALALAAIAAVLIAGCSSEPTPSQPTTSLAPAEHGSFAHCLHEHGVPDSAGTAGLGPPAGINQATWDQAMKDCSTLAPGPGGA